MYLAIAKYKLGQTLIFVKGTEDTVEQLLYETIQKRNVEETDFAFKKEYFASEAGVSRSFTSAFSECRSFTSAFSECRSFTSELLLKIPFPYNISEVSQLEFYIENKSKAPMATEADLAAIMVGNTIGLLQGGTVKIISYDLNIGKSYINISDVKIDFSFIEQMYGHCNFKIIDPKILKQVEHIIPPFPQTWIDEIPQVKTKIDLE